MKKIILFCFLIVTLTTCKKDYPENIPQWVKDKISHCKKTHDCCDHWGGGLNIIEFKNSSGDFLYKFSNVETYTLYNYQGNILCTYSYPGVTNCTDNMVIGFTESRTIWADDPKKCN